jgi:hypothetical protein
MFEYFIIVNKTNYLYCEKIAYYLIPPDQRIYAKRISPFFIYSEHYGYIKSFDEITLKPVLVEESVLKDYEYNIKIVEKNGCHLFNVYYDHDIYYMTLPFGTKTRVFSKSGKNYYLEYGGWSTQYIKTMAKKTKKLFQFYPIKKSFLIMITNPLGSFIGNDKKFVKYKSLHLVQRKGFHSDNKVFFLDDGWLNYDDCSIIGRTPSANIHYMQDNLCKICLSNDINTSFIHGDFSHTFCCIECSTKLLSKTCPICRQDVEKIVLIY